ncbi:LysR substrate-binding domain-containing protein [Neorhizobium galegae]|uniref:LysR substrate-binding domain-containing protein n=1 Tax=Neorhizobium galegae TaxID=399 RepID=UPI0006228724|nr:LysR substrate-binding domain-containing protein [Neorhizobium galegae]CDZ26534.1 Transcriptional regulator, LysR family [Neorhizobium galegae bv. officinalis]KAA9383506.1 LysR family transcriptional regulator [Neorhizobium galegae]KAB1111639.1 LysR family transcriptional regulator [Neorhizobium galegae]MCM2500139.1 LysR substrate-binding domain-containing protein [Neorhizobium galegae]MCQ1768472.1 LysR substrate-binding domain-containing protein [Neorhizobium galegae]
MPPILMERSGEMEVFARVVQDGGFSAAARNLDITPSAVSKLIARLEARLGTRLLVRTTRALTLTEEGEAYHHAALRILQDLNDADQEAAGGAVRGRLRINTTIPFGTMFVAPAIPDFIARNPNLIVDLSFTDGIVDLVAEKTDVAIRMGNLPDSGLIARKLGQSRRVVCAAPGYLARQGSPQTPADLEHHDCLTFNFRRARPSWPFRNDGRDIAQPVKGSIVVNNGETMKQMALAGAGIARVGLFHVADEIAAGRLIPLLEDFNPGDLELVHAVYVGGGPLPHRVRAFIEHMVITLGETPLLKATS